MALTVKHAFTNAIADDPTAAAAGEVLPSHWNANHTVTGSVDATQMPALTGDVTTSAGAVATTLATVNANVGTFGDATHVPAVTVNAKGLVTGVSSVAISVSAAPAGSNTQIQFNDSGSFAGAAGLTWNKTDYVLSFSNPAGTKTVGWSVGSSALNGNPTWFNFDYAGAASSSSFTDAVQNGGYYTVDVQNGGPGVQNWYQKVYNFIDTNGLSFVPNGSGNGMVRWYGRTDFYNGSPDTGLARNAAGVVEVNTATLGTLADITARAFRLNGTTVAGLPGTPVEGMVARVTDGTAALAWGATVTGGGSTKYVVWYNGANWTVMGK